jgi:hypothetical protein
MGAALTYARCYALFALVGIAGEDDLDAPDVVVGPPPAAPRPGNGSGAKQEKGVRQRRPPLSSEQSSKLRDEMLAEIRSLNSDQDLLVWAGSRLARKNTLLETDAQLIEIAYQQRLGEAKLPQNKEVAAKLGVVEMTVGKWRRRFVEDRLEGCATSQGPEPPGRSMMRASKPPS